MLVAEKLGKEQFLQETEGLVNQKPNIMQCDITALKRKKIQHHWEKIRPVNQSEILSLCLVLVFYNVTGELDYSRTPNFKRKQEMAEECLEKDSNEN